MPVSSVARPPSWSERVRRSIVVLLAALMSSQPARAPATTFLPATVVDVSGGALEREMTITIRGNRIVGVAKAAKPDRGARVVDASGMYVIPGLWDMHTHVYFGDTAGDGTDLILPLFLANGITGVRDMGSALDPVLRARADV